MRGRGLPVVLLTTSIAVVAAFAVVAWRKPATLERPLIRAINRMTVRPLEGRFATDAIDYQPYGQVQNDSEQAREVRSAAHRLAAKRQSASSIEAGRYAAIGYACADEPARARSMFVSLLAAEDSDWSSINAAVVKCNDAQLLTDFSAAMTHGRSDTVSEVLAYEAADRAVHLAPTVAALWNRAVIAERLGMYGFATRAWADIARRESSPDWREEAQARHRRASARAAARTRGSHEVFFYRELMQRAAAGQPLTDVAGDHLASDTAAGVGRLRETEQRLLANAIATYLRGRDEFEQNDFDDAAHLYALAEREFDALKLPLALIARDQRIRSECSQGHVGCLASLQSFRNEVESTSRYPWLDARVVYAVGQTLYRQGRVYEAAEQLQAALISFDKVGDVASASHMHVLLANVYAAAGESERALQHFFKGLSTPPPQILDRRRRQLQDAIPFMVRHRCLATAELLLDDLTASTTTPAANVAEATLRGVVAFRRGNRKVAAEQFANAHALALRVPDASARADVEFRLAIAEAGSRIAAPNPVLQRLDDAIAQHEKGEFLVWLPVLLTERGAALELRRDFLHAEADYRKAIEIHEAREPRIDQTIFSLGIAGDFDSAFDRLITLLLNQQRIDEALAIAERSTALRISSLHARGAGVQSPFRERRDDSDAVARLRATLRPDEIAIAQYLTRNEVITWVVERAVLRVVRRGAAREQIIRAASRERSDDSARETASRLLLRDWIDSIPKAATLLIQPPAELPGMAFSILTTRSGEPFLARNPVTTAPSFSAFLRALREDRTRDAPAAAFFAAAPAPGGDLPSLPLTMTEVALASRVYPAAKVEPRATRAQFLASSADAGTVHFAGHIVVDEAQPLFSALVFQNGERLYVHELNTTSFRDARLVVLSGCDSGRSPRPTMSVANALLRLGVPSVVYTLWPVTDEAAEVFSVAFHEAVHEGIARAEAVRRAQLAVMKKWPNDRSAWGAFALAGSGRGMSREGERDGKTSVANHL